jgi:transcriptional regulator with XRE-family HTH domain
MKENNKKRSVKMQNRVTKKILKIVRTYLKEEDIILSELARRSDISKSWLSKLQNTDANLSVDTASRLLKNMGYELIVRKRSSKQSSQDDIMDMRNNNVKDLRTNL